ncbi:nitrogenase iron-molybdenum cofactor biosynthesis protein NifN [Rhodopila globiformis]|uniref:Nitrogenase iron-molybdenum cofactor biosynthesis protein NifN n=1 Tax=Rhodopila globiformis TaxID=1071 RepID=A0A2S6NK77_RHOGL|nr:nitrogenase iron-molybdenum cofactor biosynthesis protein NifN [Rhodopila globiformis]PPQ35354.1 nitrogenase iron-molybdenum cofactor biosynthesis protein NifN [Rhodopila globiformis]
MAEILTPTKALAVNPLKTSQPIGASLAFLGLARSMPLEHGARGCTSFNKLFFMRHFHEPIALQTTAMDHVIAVMGADANVVEALATICAKDRPSVIGLITTGLSEMQGADIQRTVAMFRSQYPAHDDVIVIPVATTDTIGCLESGFARAVEAIITALVPETPGVRRDRKRVNVLASAMLTPGDIEAVKTLIGAFGLSAIMLPDIADSLDGHLIEQGFSTLTYGGTPPASIPDMSRSAATLVIGPSLNKAADLLRNRTGVPDYRFASLIGLEACDAFCRPLSEIAGCPVPPGIRRQRDQLQDAMVDCQFQLGGARVAIAADADLLSALTGFFNDMGSGIVAAVATARASHLADLPLASVVIGDLEDLEILAREGRADMIVTNSHGVEIARRQGTALLRAGFPIYDCYGAHARAWVGYAGTRQLLFETANLLAAHYQEIRPYRSRYWQGTPRADESGSELPC